MSAQRYAATRKGRRVIGVVTAIALGAVFTVLLSAVARLGDAGGAASDHHRIAYFADWNTANRGYSIADVEESGAADRLTRMLWAFGDVDSSGECFISPDADQPWEIYQRRYDAGDSIDGEADEYSQPLAGSLNQLRKLREDYSQLGASISVGGWNTSTHISTAVRTEESREDFVSSCIDLWIRGDLPKLNDEPQGGEGAAEGVFDGIDLDWEWPGGGGHPDNTEHPDDRRNFTLVVQEFRSQLDALEQETGEEYTLSISVANTPELIEASYEPEVFESVDFATLQGYDFTGSWSRTTDHHSQLYAPSGHEDDPSSDRAVRLYRQHGLPAEKIVLGFPGFGRGWTGVGPEDFGRYASAEGPADGDYGEGTDSYADLEQKDGQRFFDPVNGAYWLYDGTEWWTYDTPEVVALKGAYVRREDLAGLMMWNLDMDPEGELVQAMDESLEE